jgi:hypothetical protein
VERRMIEHGQERERVESRECRKDRDALESPASPTSGSDEEVGAEGANDRQASPVRGNEAAEREERRFASPPSLLPSPMPKSPRKREADEQGGSEGKRRKSPSQDHDGEGMYLG